MDASNVVASMHNDTRLLSSRFPRASAYHPEWVLAGVSGGANPLWLAEWLTEAMDLKPGQRVLDLGCGRALSSIFLHREFGVRVWAADLWFDPWENLQRVKDGGVEDGVFPLKVDARSLPFPRDFFDAVVSIDCLMYFGTDDLFLNQLARVVKPGGAIGVALAGFQQEIDDAVPDHLAGWWAQDRPYFLHSAAWWRRHWQRTGLVNVDVCDTLPDGWRHWRDWLRVVAPGNDIEINAIEADAGRNFAYVRSVAHRRLDASPFDMPIAIPMTYTPQPLLRSGEPKLND